MSHTNVGHFTCVVVPHLKTEWTRGGLLRGVKYAKIGIYDMIKGNESLVENVQFLFSYTISHNIKMLYFDANPITYWDIWLQSYEEYVNAKNNINKGIWTLFLPISQKQYHRHPTHSAWSCHTFFTNEQGNYLTRQVRHGQSCELAQGKSQSTYTLQVITD